MPQEKITVRGKATRLAGKRITLKVPVTQLGGEQITLRLPVTLHRGEVVSVKYDWTTVEPITYTEVVLPKYRVARRNKERR